MRSAILNNVKENERPNGNIAPIVDKPCSFDNLDTLFNSLKRNNGNTEFKGELKSADYGHYDYYFTASNAEFDEPLKRLSYYDSGRFVQSEKKLALDFACKAMNNVNTIVQAYGHSDLINVSLKTNKVFQPRNRYGTKDNNYYQTVFRTNPNTKYSYDDKLEAGRLQDFNIMYAETAIYRSVIDGMVHSICDVKNGKAYIKPEIASYIDKCIENSPTKTAAETLILSHCEKYNATFCAGSQGVYTDPERIKYSHPEKYMAMAMLFTGYYYDKVSKLPSTNFEQVKQVTESQQMLKLAAPGSQEPQKAFQPVSPAVVVSQDGPEMSSDKTESVHQLDEANMDELQKEFEKVDVLDFLLSCDHASKSGFLFKSGSLDFANGNCVGEIRGGQIYKGTYDDKGNVISEIEIGGFSNFMDIYKMNRELSVSIKVGRITDDYSIYDLSNNKIGQMTSIIVANGDAAHQIVSIKDLRK